MAPAAGNSSSSLRSSSSLPNLLLWLLNLSLLVLVLAAATIGPVFLRPRPTPFGWALVSVHAVTLLPALVAFYAQLTRHHCLPAHASLAVAALCSNALASYAFFLRRDRSLALLGSARDRGSSSCWCSWRRRCFWPYSWCRPWRWRRPARWAGGGRGSTRRPRRRRPPWRGSAGGRWCGCMRFRRMPAA